MSMSFPILQTIKHHMKAVCFLLPVIGKYFSFIILIKVLDFPESMHSFEADLDISGKRAVLFTSFPTRTSVKMAGFLK